MVKDFIHAALPWIALGIGVAVAAAYSQHGKSEKEDNQCGPKSGI